MIKLEVKDNQCLLTRCTVGKNGLVHQAPNPSDLGLLTACKGCAMP